MKILTCACNNQYYILGTNYYIKNNNNLFSLMKKGSNVPFHSYIEKFCIFEFKSKKYIICVTKQETIIYLFSGVNNIEKILSVNFKKCEEWYINLNMGIRLISVNSNFEFRYNIPKKIESEKICNNKFRDENINLEIENTKIFDSVCIKISEKIFRYKN